MRPLPTGTLTLLFSDIEGSTSLLNGLGPRWGDALSAQRRILRAAFAAHDGHEMGTEGDSFFVVFTSAHEALLAAVEAQRGLAENEWPDGIPLRVRIGLHTGEPERHEDGYIGIDVHRAARIAATANGGQIVMSASTRTLIGGHPPGITIDDLGWHRLKDLPDPEHLFDVTAPGIPQVHKPIRSLGTRANLPSYATELIGRTTEVAELCDAIQIGRARLITLIGPGGTGKTRLAVAVANELRDRVACDIYFVPLHTADRAALMWSGIAETVGAPGDVDKLPHERALSFLAGHPAFLVLDNLEQIADADSVVGELLSQAPRVSILVTSRRPLHLVEERQYPVSPLAVPEEGEFRTPEDARSGAVELFVRRAAMVKPSFALTPDNVADVVALCRRLDGLPLAIELTAARVRLLSPRALLSRLDDRLGATETQVRRTERQRTLRATISWSYDLLDDDDQRVFRHLGVFSSKFDLDAVAAVAGSREQDPLDVVAHLVDVSLVEIVEGPDGEPMIWLLETIRRFARDQLRESGEYDAVRLRHARWCLEDARAIRALLDGPRQMSALDRMDAVEEDIRAALDWCLTPATVAWGERQECGLALLEAMDTYWYRFSYIAEGRGWHDRALAMLSSRGMEDDPRIVDALHGQGVLAVQQNDLATGAQALERALAMASRLGDAYRESRESNSLGIARREAGDTAAARSLIERSLALAREINDPRREATALANMVHMHMDVGDYPAAVAAARRAIAADRALNDPWGVAISQSNLITALLNAEGPEPAYRQLIQVAPDAVALGDPELTVDLLESCAMVWAGLGDAERAATLVGAADRDRSVIGIPRAGPDSEHLERFLGPARAALGAQFWENAYERGHGLTVAEALRLGLQDRAGAGQSRR